MSHHSAQASLKRPITPELVILSAIACFGDLRDSYAATVAQPLYADYAEALSKYTTGWSSIGDVTNSTEIRQVARMAPLQTMIDAATRYMPYGSIDLFAVAIASWIERYRAEPASIDNDDDMPRYMKDALRIGAQQIKNDYPRPLLNQTQIFGEIGHTATLETAVAQYIPLLRKYGPQGALTFAIMTTEDAIDIGIVQPPENRLRVLGFSVPGLPA